MCDSEGFGGNHTAQQAPDVVVQQLINLHLEVSLGVPLSRVLDLDFLLSGLAFLLYYNNVSGALSTYQFGVILGQHRHLLDIADVDLGVLHTRREAMMHKKIRTSILQSNYSCTDFGASSTPARCI